MTRRTWLIVLFGFILPALLLMVTAALIAQYSELTINIFTDEPSFLFEFPWYAGAISSIGTFLWISSATVCVFTFMALGQLNESYARRNLLIQSAVLLLVLALDDFFSLHDVVFRFYLGVPEMVTYALYALATAGLVIANRKTIMESDYPVLFLAGAFFAASILLDILVPIGRATSAVEDTAKLLGIVLFLAYYSMFALTALTEAREKD